jgi:serine/threonine protein kinase
VAATIRNAPSVLSRSLLILLGEGVHFKVVSNINMLDKINQGKFGLSQMGKFITIYPQSDMQAVKLARVLDKALREFEGPLILSDRPLRKGSLVHYRYGSFREDGGISYIIDPSGRKIKDKRDIYFNPPSWVKDPFVKKKQKDQKRKDSFLRGKFLILGCLYQGPGGGVYRALDLRGRKPHFVIIKEARKHAVEDSWGRDARERLKHEESILKKLSGVNSVPRVYELFNFEENLYLVMEYLSGESLEHLIRRKQSNNRFISEKEIRRLGIKICEAIEPIHKMKIVIRDLKPFHIRLTKGRIYIIDFETAYDLKDKNMPFLGLSRGFSSPQLARGYLPSFQDDIFSLGSILYYMITNMNPAIMPIKRGPRGIIKYNQSVSRKMKEIILTALHTEPSKRFRTISELKEALEDE